MNNCTLNPFLYTRLPVKTRFGEARSDSETLAEEEDETMNFFRARLDDYFDGNPNSLVTEDCCAVKPEVPAFKSPFQSWIDSSLRWKRWLATPFDWAYWFLRGAYEDVKIFFGLTKMA